MRAVYRRTARGAIKNLRRLRMSFVIVFVMAKNREPRTEVRGSIRDAHRNGDFVISRAIPSTQARNAMTLGIKTNISTPRNPASLMNQHRNPRATKPSSSPTHHAHPAMWGAVATPWLKNQRVKMPNAAPAIFRPWLTNQLNTELIACTSLFFVLQHKIRQKQKMSSALFPQVLLSPI